MAFFFKTASQKTTQFGFVFFMVLLSSCLSESISDIEIINAGKKLVVNGHLSPDSKVMISVTNNIPINWPQVSDNITNAEVQLWQNGNLIETGIYEIPDVGWMGFYTFESQIEAEKTYQIVASAPTYPTATAFDLVPGNSLMLKTFDIIAIDQVNNKMTVEVDFDLVGDAEYFHFIFFLKQTIIDVVSMIRISEEESGLLSKETKGIVFDASDPNTGILFQRRVFEESGTKRILILSDIAFGFVDRDFLEVKVEARTVSNDYYQYYASATKQRFNYLDRFATPALIYNNVTNGLGNVSGYSSVSSEWKNP